MRVYTVHLPPPYSVTSRDPETIREGFCWGAFLFTVLWALWHRLWLAAFLLFAAATILGIAVRLAGFGDAGGMVTGLAVMVFAGLEGNDWRRAGLARRGWRQAAVTAGPDAETALRRYADLASLDDPRGRSGILSVAPAPVHVAEPFRP